MRLIALMMLVLSLFPAPLTAQSVGPGDTVLRQFEAFRADDMEQAFSYASPMIKGYFRTPGNFGRMVEQGYPMVRDPGRVRLLDLREEGGKRLQRVEVIDGKGMAHTLDYEMIETEDGWKINGVTFTRAPMPAV
ncbi:DUF4864 domain-containing protein [Pseudooceanicola sp. C21-150M6]|uniref:DUF4864 domain-containing protein n=1 Tax=Pseudooceanicola sp. C21-150M6 TaxID=3434355 RepID=UPI003D7FF9C3